VTHHFLTIAEAAECLGLPRPYVSMLADSGKLGEVSERGDGRVVTTRAVDAYLRAPTQEHADAKTPREAAAEAGLYSLETLSIELDIPVAVLRISAAISDPTNQPLFTREALVKTLKKHMKSGQITDAQGNFFADLGFQEEEAKRLLEEADEQLMSETARKPIADKGGAADDGIEDL